MENRNGLIVDAMVTQADGTAERDAGASLMLHLQVAEEHWRWGPRKPDQRGSRQGLRHAGLRTQHLARLWNAPVMWRRI